MYNHWNGQPFCNSYCGVEAKGANHGHLTVQKIS